MDSPVFPWCSLLQLCWLWIKAFVVGCPQLQTLGVSAWRQSSRDAPHSLGSCACQAGGTLLVLQVALTVLSAGSAAQAITA